MARIRTIKPEFWTSAQVLECSTNARLLFVGLWNFADDAGRHPDNPKQCKAEVFPADDFQLDAIQGMLDELSENGLIVRYVHGGKGFFYVSGWHHQRIDKPQPPKYPDPFDEHSEVIQGTFLPDRKGKEGKGKDKYVPSSSSSTARSEIEEIFDHWKEVHNHPRAQLDEKRRKVIQRALKSYSSSDLKLAIDGCKKSEFHQGKNDTGAVYDSLQLILRDGDKIDSFIALAAKKPKGGEMLFEGVPVQWQ